MLELGNRLQGGGKLSEAAVVFSFLAFEGALTTPYLSINGEDVRRKWTGEGSVFFQVSRWPKAKLETLANRGAFFPRLALGIARIPDSILAPENIFPFMAGAAVFQAARTFTLAKFAAIPEAAWFQRGWAARFAAAGVGLAAEAPLVGFGGRWLSQAQGKPVSESPWGDMRRAALTLGAFRGAGFAARQLSLRWHGIPELGFASQAFSLQARQWFFSQAAIFGGLYLDHRAENWAEPTTGSSFGPAELLLAWVDLQAAGNLVERGLSPRFRRAQYEAGAAAEIYYQARQEGWKQKAQAWGDLAWEAWKNRPVGPVLMGLGMGTTHDPVLYEHVQQGVRATILAQVAQGVVVGETPSGTGFMKIDIYFDRNTGRILSPSEAAPLKAMPNRVLQLQVRANVLANQVIIPQRLRQGMATLLEGGQISPQEREIFRALQDLHEQRIGDLVEVARQHRGNPNPKTTKMAAIVRHADQQNPQKTFLEAQASAVLAETSRVGHLPLLRFVAPPVLMGELVVDSRGHILGSSLGRPMWNGDGARVNEGKTVPGPQEAGIEVMLSESGRLLRYWHGESSPAAREVFQRLLDLPETRQDRRRLLEDFPYLEEMAEGRGMGKLLLDLHETMSPTVKTHQLFLLEGSSGYSWSLAYPNQGYPPNTLSRLYVSLAPTQAGAPPQFRYKSEFGKPPPEVQRLLEWVQGRVAQAAAERK